MMKMDYIKERMAYKEVVTILEEMELTQYIPKKILDSIKKVQDNNYIFSFDKDKPLEDQNISREAGIILNFLYLAYICDDETKKEEFKEIFEKNKE